ncbi:SgcJ/EcaC family oxidoreductase [Rugosimonospora africana]|uniref:DUF4440 domain-containing protein n=1 Tax=Rugosimonospora africana TaxID=556532 RepID=A0A8J3R0R0_9ACTN|nr:SgcJ/EcaC family oxidoreductase [Rugosimonospora africana]GIH19724.1 hypothetical protein Raf01_78960 [Rugosimonospora africana]
MEPTGDERAVRAVIEAVSQAWADNDAAAFVDHYAEDATAILPGFLLPDKAEIRTRMAEAFAAQLKGSRRIHQVRKVRFPNATTAIVTSRSGTAFPGETEPSADRWSLATWVLSQHAGRWLIEAYHDCPAA